RRNSTMAWPWLRSTIRKRQVASRPASIRCPACWGDVLSKTTRQFQPDVVHLHHLNHVHLAAIGLASMRRLPKLAHLHGTELKMLQEMSHLTVRDHGEIRLWDEALRQAAAGMQHFVLISPDNVERSKQILALEADKLSFIPN